MLRAYASGVFPMSEGRENPEVFWVEPRKRGVMPLDGFHISRSLRRAILKGEYRVSVNAAFVEVIEGCANRPETWINQTITELYHGLFEMGHGQSLEVWRDTDLIGGVYGVTLGGAFFGESMFSRATNASKIALAYLVDRLRESGFVLFDTQFLTPHLASLGAEEIPRSAYLARLREALAETADFARGTEVPSPQRLMQRSTQTS